MDSLNKKGFSILFGFFAFVAICIMFSCKTPSLSTKTFEINGTIEGLKTGSVKLVGYDYTGYETILQQSKITKGAFYLKGNIKDITEGYLIIDSAYEAFLFLEPKQINIKLNVTKVIYEDFYKVLMPSVSGSEINTLYQDYLNLEDSIHALPEFKKLQTWYDETFESNLNHQPNNDDTLSEDILFSKQHLDEKINMLRMDFTLKNPNSILSPYILLNEANGFDISTYSLKNMEIICNSFGTEIKNNIYKLECESIYKSAKRFAPGKSAPKFTLQSIDGNKVSLDTFKGKYVLLYFWTYWCGNCTEPFDDLKTIYESYSDKGFEIIGISDDPEVNVWKKTVEKYQLPWQQLIVDKESNISSSYDLGFLPTLFLLDKNGAILKKDLTLSELKKELNILLN